MSQDTNGGSMRQDTRVVDIENELQTSYLDYAMSVIIGRALPDVRDGLKPVHRRVLYGMWEGGNRSSRPYKKSARIVGDVMGKYHPHGDSAIYDTIVRLAQDFSMRYMLVDGQGNFGSIDGDSAAAMRYTEVRLTRLSEEMIKEDIDKDTVDWTVNYDESEMEPQVLPTRIPNLLVNGSTGIAVGMATNIPPHNLNEVIDATIRVVEDPDCSLWDICSVLPGPDFPTAGFIHGVAGIQQAYASGRGTVQVRARAVVEEQKNDRQRIVVSEIPYQVNKSRLIERIADLVRDKKVDSISDIRDESDREGIRIVIDLKKGEVGEVVLNMLYKMTQLQTTFGINMLAIVDSQPRVLNIKEILQFFIDHRRSVVVRRVKFDLRNAEARAHILEGLLKALDHIDQIISTIRASASPNEAKVELVKIFSFTEVQARAILEMRLQKLTGLERDRLVEEFEQLVREIERLRDILASDRLLSEEIVSELRNIKDKYGDERRTEIIGEVSDITIEDMIADEDMVITVTRSGYIKRSPLALYREQGRGGKGRKGMEIKNDDFVEQVYVASAHSFIMVFTESGRIYWLKVHRIPELSPASKGKAIVNLLELDDDEKIATSFAVKDFEEGFLVFVTDTGTVKRTPLKAFRNPRSGGIIAITVDEGSRLLDVKFTDGEADILLATADGFSIRFPEADETLDGGQKLTGVRSMGRVAKGVRGIDLRPGDFVVAMEALEQSGDILTVSAKGFGKRTEVSEYRRQSRGGKGILNMKVTEKTGSVVAVMQTQAGDGTVMVTQLGKIIRSSVDGVSRIGRVTQGVKLMDIGSQDKVMAVARVREKETEDADLPEPKDTTELPETVH